VFEYEKLKQKAIGLHAWVHVDQAKEMLERLEVPRKWPRDSSESQVNFYVPILKMEPHIDALKAKLHVLERLYDSFDTIAIRGEIQTAAASSTVTILDQLSKTVEVGTKVLQAFLSVERKRIALQAAQSNIGGPQQQFLKGLGAYKKAAEDKAIMDAIVIVVVSF